MSIKSYKLKKDLTGRAASQFNWRINEIPCEIFLQIHDGQVINGKSLIGLLSGRFLKDDIIEVAAKTEDAAQKIQEILNDLEII